MACQEPHGSATPRGRTWSSPALARDAVVAERWHSHQEGRRLVVYVSAVWCEPCERFQAACAPATGRILPRSGFIKFDHDQDGPRLEAVGYAGNYLPRFVVPADDGRATAQRMEGGTKADDTVFTSIVLVSSGCPHTCRRA